MAPFWDLQEVIEFYNSGGTGQSPNAGFTELRSLNLTSQETQDILEFLMSLSGPKLLIEMPALPDYGDFQE